jgi:hypothetical protein
MKSELIPYTYETVGVPDQHFNSGITYSYNMIKKGFRYLFVVTVSFNPVSGLRIMSETNSLFVTICREFPFRVCTKDYDLNLHYWDN